MWISIVLIALFVYITGLFLLNKDEYEARKIDYFVQCYTLIFMVCICWTIIIPMLLAIPLGAWQVLSAIGFIIRSDKTEDKIKWHLYYLISVFVFFLVAFVAANFWNADHPFLVIFPPITLCFAYWLLTRKMYYETLET
jgi:hypothetical protein